MSSLKSDISFINAQFGNLPLCITNHKKASKSSALANLYTSSTLCRPKYIFLPLSERGFIDNLSRKSIDSMSISIPYSLTVFLSFGLLCTFLYFSGILGSIEQEIIFFRFVRRTAFTLISSAGTTHMRIFVKNSCKSS